MFYPLVKIWVRLALRIFLRDVKVKNPAPLGTGGPMLITANHPNSFLDAIIIGAACRYPIHFLARGDAFNKPWHAGLLKLLQMIPVYRLSEGKENLALNEVSFQKSRKVLEANGVLLIFIEGICVNKYELQPFKKGAARIAIDCRHLPGMQVLPVTITYDSFSRFGKSIIIDAGEPIPVNELLPFEDEARNMREMNEIVLKKIGPMIEVPVRVGRTKTTFVEKLAAMAGRILHWPLYKLLSNLVRKKTKGTVFYDSVLFGVLLLVYPVYLLLLGLILLFFGVPVAITVLIIFLHPLLARRAVLLNP